MSEVAELREKQGRQARCSKGDGDCSVEESGSATPDDRAWRADACGLEPLTFHLGHIPSLGHVPNLGHVPSLDHVPCLGHIPCLSHVLHIPGLLHPPTYHYPPSCCHP